MEYISGVDKGQVVMLPDCVDDYVGADNPVRVIDAYIDSLELSALGFRRAQPNETGRPSYSPKDLLKLYLYGYMNRIRSSRRLEAETNRNLEVIWLMGKLSPDHKTIARFRQENSAVLKNVFRAFVKFCAGLGLYGKELLAIDGSKFKACNSRDRNFTDNKLLARIARLDSRIEAYLAQMEELDSAEEQVAQDRSRENIAQIISDLKKRKDEYEGYRREMSEQGSTQKSLTDADSRLMLANGKMDVCLNVQTAVDSKHKMVAAFDVINQAQDKNQMKPLAHQASQTLEMDSFLVVADAGYDSATDIAECLLSGFTPHVAGTEIDICVPTDEAGTQEITSYENGRCVYIRERNLAVCPMGQLLYPGNYKCKKQVALFYNTKACSHCPQKCTTYRFKRFEIIMPPGTFRKEYNADGLRLKQLRVGNDWEIVKQRKCIVEHPFGTIKRVMGFDHCLLKGIPNVSGEFSLTFLAYNMKRAINILGTKKLLQVLGG